MSQSLATPGRGSGPLGFLITNPSRRAIKTLLSGTPVTICGSRSCGSVPFPIYKICSATAESTGFILSEHEVIRTIMIINKVFLMLSIIKE